MAQVDSVLMGHQVYTSQIKHWAISKLPMLQRLDNFQLFILLNVVLIATILVVNGIRNLNLTVVLSPRNLSAKIFRFLRANVPPLRNKVDSELARIAPEIHKSILPEYRSSIKKIPRKSYVPDPGNDTQKETVKGFLSGSRYPMKDHSDFVANLSSNFIYANPLHFDIHPCVRQMQVQVIKMTAKMLNFTENGEAVGCFTSGGTESIEMAILAYRGWGRRKGITKPNLLVCTTGHPASNKACQYFDIDVRVVKANKNFEMDLSDMKSKIDNNTIGVYTSFPNYPYGTIDPFHQIAKYCEPRGIPVHLDMCLGGFLVPFLNDPVSGKPLLNIPKGVTSISVDVHKYGLAGKGASVILYSSADMRTEQYFVTSSWPGGLYGTVGISGSRSGVGIASSWISMMKLGQTGYKKSAQSVQLAVTKLASQLRSIGFETFGNPIICTIGFYHPAISTNQIQLWMGAKGWDLPLLQKPISFHYSFTPLNSIHINQMVKDFKQCVSQLKGKAPSTDPDSSRIQMYGACAKIPDGHTQNEIMLEILDCYIDV